MVGCVVSLSATSACVTRYPCHCYLPLRHMLTISQYSRYLLSLKFRADLTHRHLHGA